MPRAAVADAIDLHYARRGEGPPLLLIQGLSGHHLHWTDRFLEELEGVEAIVYDHRGTGHSAADPGPFSIADLADDAAALVQALGLRRAHVLGISMGGMVAQELALRHPERVDRLVLGCTYPGGEGAQLTPPPVVQRMLQAFATPDRERRERLLWELNVSAAAARDQALYAMYNPLTRIRPVRPEVLLGQLRATAGHDVLRRLEQVRAPTLVVHGEEDRILPPANARLIAEHVPGARLELWPGVGHLFWVEQPARTARTLEAFLLGG